METEAKIAARFLTAEGAHATLDRVLSSVDGPIATRDAVIPRLLSTAWHDFVTDSAWDMVKEFDDATISVRDLRDAVHDRLKELLPDVFG